MSRRLLKIVSSSFANKAATHPVTHAFTTADIVWVMGSFCALNRKPFDAELLVKQFPPPYTSDSFIHAARALGFKIKRRDCNSAELSKFNLPCCSERSSIARPNK
jgi:subfamily B ATP-binding cassette protein HlyB/CyaB